MNLLKIDAVLSEVADVCEAYGTTSFKALMNPSKKTYSSFDDMLGDMLDTSHEFTKVADNAGHALKNLTQAIASAANAEEKHDGAGVKAAVGYIAKAASGTQLFPLTALEMGLENLKNAIVPNVSKAAHTLGGGKTFHVTQPTGPQGKTASQRADTQPAGRALPKHPPTAGARPGPTAVAASRPKPGASIPL